MSWKPEYALLLLGCTAITYFAGVLMAEKSDRRQRKLILLTSLVAVFSFLFVFKYFNFAVSNLNFLFEKISIKNVIPYWDLLLPVGISFFTFQAGSYLIDVYRGDKKAEPHFGHFALFISFFPQIMAGPIARSGQLLPQLKQKSRFSYENITGAAWPIVMGLFKKVVVADRLGLVVAEIYKSPNSHSPRMLLIGAILFSVQIYCDFSGYSDMAIGSARLFGIKLMENFRRPYFSASVGEFWRRWHISLSSWFKDYVYIPLGGSRGGKWKTVKNILITFIVSGIWHGAAWTFLIWGGIHGALVAFEGFITGRAKIPRIFLIPITFSLITLAWIPFRANSIGDAGYIFSSITQYATALLVSPRNIVALALLVISVFAFNRIIHSQVLKAATAFYLQAFAYISAFVVLGYGLYLNMGRISLPGLSQAQSIIAIFTVLTLLIVEVLVESLSNNDIKKFLPTFIMGTQIRLLGKMAAFSLAIVFILIFGMFTKSQFIYFQF